MRKLDITKFDFIVGVPCSKFNTIINYDNVIISTKEDEAVGMAVGASLCEKKSLVFLQNSGLMNTLDIITSLLIPYNIQIPFLISLRTKPEHHKFCGTITKKILKLVGLNEYYIIED